MMCLGGECCLAIRQVSRFNRERETLAQQHRIRITRVTQCAGVRTSLLLKNGVDDL